MENNFTSITLENCHGEFTVKTSDNQLGIAELHKLWEKVLELASYPHELVKEFYGQISEE